MLHLIYGATWNPQLMVMLDPVGEDQARAAYESGAELTIAGGPEPLLGIDPEDLSAPDGEDPATWSIHARLDTGYLGVAFYNPWGTKEADYTFRRQDDGHLFLGEVWEYTYTDPTQRRATWSTAQHLVFQPDGHSRHTRITNNPDGSQSYEETEHAGGDLSHHVEPVPAFGEWGGVLKRQR